MESKLTIEGLEKERDFYFGKLRDIEVLAQEHENDGGEFVQKALAVLYATEVFSVEFFARTVFLFCGKQKVSFAKLKYINFLFSFRMALPYQKKMRFPLPLQRMRNTNSTAKY